MINEARYIQSYAKIIGVKEEAAISYAQKKGTLALINNASGLLTTKTQREKHKAFVDLYRMSSELHHENPVLSSPEAVTSFMQSVMEHIHDKEAMMAVFLDTKNRVIDYEEVSLGTINSSIVHPREIFRGAVINKANAIILCHNHPSGNLTPSGEDKTITLRLKEAGKLMGIEVLDHVIISGIEKDRYYSFKESGVLEETIRYGKKIQKETDKENKSALSVSSSIKETGTNYEVTDAPFEAFITNLGKYNEGELVGEWVAFPTDRETLQEVFKRIGIGSENELGTVYEEIFISDYDCRIGNLYNVLGEYESLNELNYLASKIEELSESEKEHFEAAMEISDYAGSVKDLINLTENLDRYEVYPRIEDYDDLGRMYIDEYGILEVPDHLKNYFDYAAYGRDVAMDEGGSFTSYGYIRDNYDTFREFYHGNRQDIPEEYLITGNIEEPEPEKSDTLTVLMVEPGKEAYVTEIKSDISSLQAQVGGLIESVYAFHDPVVLVCNDEGKINGMDLNRALYDETGNLYDIIGGPFFIAGLSEDGFTSLSTELCNKYQERFKTPEIFANIGGEIVAIPVTASIKEKKENYLRAAELSQEQNYNMIDGQLNNIAPKKTHEKPSSVLARLKENEAMIQKNAAEKKQDISKIKKLIEPERS